MSECVAAKVCVYRFRVRVEEIVHGVDHGIRRFVIDRCDGGFFEALDKLIDGGDRYGGVGEN